MKLCYKGLASMGSLIVVAYGNDVNYTFLHRRVARTLHHMHFLSRKLQTCTLNEDIVYCDTTRSCANLELQGCIVYCMDDSSCAGATIKNSSVFCEVGGSCSSATILDANVECAVDNSCRDAVMRRTFVLCNSQYACDNTVFASSVLTATDSAWTWSNFVFNDQCTCSDAYEDDPSWLCTIGGAPSEEFCSLESAGLTCATLGNPICSGVPGYSTPTPSDPAPAPSEPEGNTPAPSPLPVVPAESELTTDSPSPVESSEPEGNYPASPLVAGSTPNDTTQPPIVAIVVPVVVALIGLVGVVLTRKQIVHVYDHYRAGATANNSAKP